MNHARDSAKQAPVVIGLMGTTGAGKSSVINAILGEKNLVPTSGMRACTSVATEISFNHDRTHKYRAEVEFRTQDEWTVDLTNLYNDLLDETSNPKPPGNEKTDAFGRIHAVFRSIKARSRITPSKSCWKTKRLLLYLAPLLLLLKTIRTISTDRSMRTLTAPNGHDGPTPSRTLVSRSASGP